MLNDNSIVLAVVIAVTIAFRQWRHNRPDASLLNKAAQILLPALVSGVAAFGASYAVHSYNTTNNRNAAADQVIEQSENTPLIGAILKDEPQYREKLRAAVQSNTGAGRAIITEIRNKYAKPTVWSAPDAAVMSALGSAARVRDNLEKQSARLCSEYMMTGVKNLDDLSPQNRQIFNDSLSDMEKVYVQGKGQPPRAVPPTEDQISGFFQIVGFNQQEIEALNNKGSDEARCSAGEKIYSAVGKLKPEYKSVFARYLLTQGG